MNMQRSKTRHAACSCIVLLMCVRHGTTHIDKYIDDFHSVYSSELYLPEDYTPSILDTDSSEEYRTDEMGWGNTAKSVQWPPDDVRHTHEDSNENLKSFGGIYDYLITDQNVWHGGGGGNTKPNSNGETFRAIDQDSSEWDKGASERERDSWETDDDSSEKDRDSSETDDDSSETDDDSSEKDKDSSEGDGDSSAEDSSETAEDSSEREEDSSESNVESSGGGKCEIQYFYDIDVKSAKCRMEKEGCHLEYSGFRTVIPDLKRCLVENNRCILQKGAKRVMLPFTRIGCKKYRQNPRMSNEPIHDVNNETQENSCEFHYMDELAFNELACELKEGECFLSDGNRMTIILDEENCRLENGTCVASQDFKTDLPFVGKDCREFDPAPKIRKRRQIQTYPGYDCRLQRFQNLGFYTDVNCALWGGECFLELDNMITVAPDGENCFLYGGRCYVSSPFRMTNIPLVDKACMVLDEFTEGYSEVQTGQMNEFYVYPMMRTIYDETSMMYGRAAYDFPDENGIPRVQNEGQPSEPSRNDLSDQQPRAARKGASKGDIFTNSNYTTCVLLVRKKKDKVEKRCYPGNDNTVQYDRGKNCRMIQGHCFRVRKDPEFLKEYFSTPHNNILTCVMLGKECYMLDGDMLLYKKEECHEPVCRALVADPVNPGAYCDFIDCGDSDDSDDPEDSEHAGQIGGEVPVTVLDNDMAEGLSDGLKQILPKNHTTGKPVGIFYSMSFIYNDSLSAVYTSPNSSDQSAGSSSGDGDNNGQNFDKNDSGDKNLPEVKEEVDEEEETEDITDEIDDYDYDEEYDLPSSRKSVKKDPVSSDIWRDAKFTDCIFHMTMRKKRWETKCYPGNQNTDEISPQDAHNCRLIDGECYKVHRDRKFLSSYFKNPPNRMLKCVIVEDDCYLKDKNLLLFNSDDCYESICGQLRSDGKVPGNFCDSSKCGHSKPNLVSFKEVKGARRSLPRKSTTSLGNIEDHMVAPLLKTLKAVVPQTDFEGDPSSVVYSIGLLYNDPDSSPSKVRKVGEVLSRRKNDTIERGSQSLPEGKDVTNSTDQKDSEISRRNNGTTESESLISFTEQEANGSEISNSTENVINGNSNEQQIVISPDGLGRSAKTESSDGKYQSIDSKEPLPNPARSTFDSREVDEPARYENYKREGKSNGVANGGDQETEKTDYFMHYLPVPLDSKSDGGVVLQRKRAKYSINDKKNIPNKRKGKSGSGAPDKEYFFNPDFPFTFLGSYPGTDGWNDTLIMHENSYTSHDEDVPTVQEISTRTVHFHDDFGPHDVDKEAILDFVANFPWPGWCYPEQDEEEAGTCCETHEDCEDRIEPSEKKFGLENKSLFKRLHCACEFNFFKCLKGNGDVISNSLGVAYFNIIAPKCFASEQRIFCLSRNRWKKCVKYGYDQKSEKGYQWVDTPTY